MSKVICFGFVIGLEISSQFINHSHKTQTNRARDLLTVHVFSRAWRQLHVYASSSDWFTRFSESVVIGQSDYLALA